MLIRNHSYGFSPNFLEIMSIAIAHKYLMMSNIYGFHWFSIKTGYPIPTKGFMGTWGTGLRQLLVSFSDCPLGDRGAMVSCSQYKNCGGLEVFFEGVITRYTMLYHVIPYCAMLSETGGRGVLWLLAIGDLSSWTKIRAASGRPWSWRWKILIMVDDGLDYPAVRKELRSYGFPYSLYIPYWLGSKGALSKFPHQMIVE